MTAKWKGLLKVSSAFMLLICMISGTLLAGTTGKISGVVKDQETNNPLIGANVIIEGTSLGAATNADGEFNILNIPPGIHTIRASMMGYNDTRVEDVRVRTDLTTAQNFSLTTRVLEAGETVTIIAEQDMIQPDMTGSMASVGSEEISNLPVESMGEVLEMQAGIVRTGGDFHIRGGRAGEIAYWVDGVSTTDVYNNRMGVTVENAAIEELQVVSGTFNAEYGNAMSGIVNIITKEGGRRYEGFFRGYVGDYVSWDDKFSLLDGVDIAPDPVTGAIDPVGIKDNPLTGFNPSYNGELNLSGPVPFLKNKLSFFVNGRYFSNEGYFYGRNWYTPQGNPGDSSLVPMNPYWRYSGQGKLTYRMSSNIKLSYNVFFSQYKNDRTYSQAFKYVPYGQPQQQGNSITHIFSLNHLLSQKTFYELRVNRFHSEYERYMWEIKDDGSLATPHYLVQVNADSANNIAAELFDPTTTEGAAHLEQLQAERINYKYIIDPDGPAGYIHPDSSSLPTSYSFNNMGMDMNYFNRSTAYWVGKLDLTSQVTPIHQMKTGVEVKVHELTLDGFTVRPALTETGEEVKPFQPAIPDISTVYRNIYNQKPRELSAYIQDKIELNDLIVNVGLRYDYFNSNAMVPSDPSDPNIYYPFKNEHRYRGWTDPPDDLTREEYEAYMAQYEEYTPDERRAFMHKEAETSMQLSPRLGLAYPITDEGVIHFSYGHFFQTPEFQYLYQNPDFKLSAGGGYFIFGNPALKPQRTTQYEIGLQQQLTSDIKIDVTLFYRDIRDWVGTSPLINTPIPSVKYAMFENKDYSNVRGIEVRLDKRYSHNFSMGVDYLFQIAEGTYSNPTDEFNAIQAQQEPSLALLPLNWDQRHTLNGSIIYQLSSWTFSLIGRYSTGLPYTPSFATGEVVGAAAVIGLKNNSARLPNRKSVDLLIRKRIDVAGLNFQLFMNIYNVLDTRDETNVYTDTGSANYTTTTDPNKIPYNPLRVGTIEEFVLQPGWYSSPREIRAGVSIGF